MEPQIINTRFTLLLLPILLSVSFAGSDNSKDREECAESFVGLATCLPYVEGTANAPTTDCCNGLKQLLKTKRKCLCVVIEDRNDPDLGLNVNVTLALGLPQVCSAPANISQCPALLNLPPDSPDAQIFYQTGQKSSNSSSNSPVSGGPNANVMPNPINAPATADVRGSIYQQESGCYDKGKRYLTVLLWAFTAILIV
ncbi:hypothetical protein CDL12_17045 [Handroanthus impetiginosus]|uniref:Bifunctional inhibitor/plant lipid transfer protein/seed storage helical domain-containing protein n=1 Tax=Handroanthus impetiginosus TaxID=429701 RepID=A0A2G9GYR0_9LAMI|nr:hypothetical protein CDL12_17045 [Handroanthus impetiginosus]